MKKIILSSLVLSTSLLATNGDNLIGFGAKSRAMGGVGIATYFGSENTLGNPALISKLERDEVDLGITYFAPTIKTNGASSSADQNFIPYSAYASRYDQNIVYGLGAFGSAGMGVDFRDSSVSSLAKARTNLILMKVVPSIAYQKGDFSFGFSPIIQYGSLIISYINIGGPVGGEKSGDFGYGYKAGVSYELWGDLRVAATYQSPIAMNYKNTISVAATPFGKSFSDKLEQPSEYGIGFSYDFDAFNISADYKKINWASADGYSDFGWMDQDVYALGAKYEKNGTWYALGYNYAATPLKNTDPVINAFNYIFFPATQERHFSVGAGTKISPSLSLGASAVYGEKNTISTNGATGAINVAHSETSLNISMKYIF